MVLQENESLELTQKRELAALWLAMNKHDVVDCAKDTALKEMNEEQKTVGMNAVEEHNKQSIPSIPYVLDSTTSYSYSASWGLTGAAQGISKD